MCVAVSELIDTGYFTNEILGSEIGKNIYVSNTDKVYLERNKDSKTITNKYFDTEGKCESIGSRGNNRTVVAGITLRHTGSLQDLVVIDNIQGDVYFSTNIQLTSDNYLLKGSKDIPKNKNIGEYYGFKSFWISSLDLFVNNFNTIGSGFIFC